MEQTVWINGMKCQGCANTVKDKLSVLDSVSDVSISLDDNTAIIQSSNALSKEEVERSLAETNYSVEKVQ